MLDRVHKEIYYSNSYLNIKINWRKHEYIYIYIYIRIDNDADISTLFKSCCFYDDKNPYLH